MPFVYVLRCADDRLYIGVTDDVLRRVSKHNEGTASWFTAQRRPVEVVYVEAHATRLSAFRRERQLKGWTRAKKEAWPMTIRREVPADLSAIHRLVEAAFGRRAEADLVDRLREACDDAVSLVADDRGTIVGHVLFSPVVIELPQRRVAGMGLAPLAVAPDRQRHGIGSNLVRRGLAILIERGCPFVVVLGDPGYYRRFGFDTASRRGLASQWDGIPDHTFMALILDDDAMAAVSGIARYRREFEELA